MKFPRETAHTRADDSCHAGTGCSGVITTWPLPAVKRLFYAGMTAAGITQAVIASAVVPTLIAGKFFLPVHLLPRPEKQPWEAPQENGLGEEG